mmetsp:Transcript_9114/g.19396  ORF Transcript_9114/g.19396 Transcript_9114/m.19396 type:complete len:100 (-) Transcript_9114:401-700(-)
MLGATNQQRNRNHLHLERRAVITNNATVDDGCVLVVDVVIRCISRKRAHLFSGTKNNLGYRLRLVLPVCIVVSSSVPLLVPILASSSSSHPRMTAKSQS